MGAEPLVGRTGQEVDVELCDIHDSVRSEMDGVHEGESAHRVGSRHNLLHWIDRSDRVGGVAEGHKARSRTDLALQIIEIERAVLRMDIHRLDHQAAVSGDRSPR